MATETDTRPPETGPNISSDGSHDDIKGGLRPDEKASISEMEKRFGQKPKTHEDPNAEDFKKWGDELRGVLGSANKQLAGNDIHPDKDNDSTGQLGRESGKSNSSTPQGFSTDANSLKNILGSTGKVKGVFDLFKRKKGFTVGTLIAIIAAAVISTTALGPLKFLNMAEMLQDFTFQDQDISMSHRVRNLVTYSQLARGKDSKLENTRLGTIEAYRAHKIDKKLAKSGIKIEYTRPGGRFDRITIDMDNMSDNMKEQLKGLKTDKARNAKIAEFYGIDASAIEREGSVISIKAQGKNKWVVEKNIRQILNRTLKLSPDFSKKATALRARQVLNKRTNVQMFDRLTKARENIKSKIAEKLKEIQDERKRYLSTKDAGLDKLPDKNEPGSKWVKKIATSRIGGTVADTLSSIDGAVATSSTGIGVAVAVIQISCTVRDSTDMLSKIQTVNKVMPMMDAATELSTVSSKLKAGQVDGEFLNYYNKSFTNPKGTNGQSSIYKFISNDGKQSTASNTDQEEQTFNAYPELNPDNKGFFQDAQDIIQNAENLYNQAESAVPVIGQMITAYNSLPASVKPTDDIKSSDLACGVVNLPSDLLSKISDFIGPHLPLYSTFQSLIQKLGSKIISWIAGSAIDLSAEKYAGSPYIESIGMGFRYFGNESAMGMGGSVLTDAQEQSNNVIAMQYAKEEDNRTLIAKTFDVKDYRSPAAKIASNFYDQGSLASVASIPSQTISNISSLLSKKASAATPPSQVFYGVPKVGFDINKLDDEIYADPYANAEIVYDRLSNDPDKKAHFTECTGLTITDSFDFEIKSYEEDGSPLAMYNQPGYKEKCKDMETDETLYRTRLLALDTISLKSFSCLEYNDEQSCQELLPEQKNNTACGADTTSTPTEDTSNKLYWPVRDEGHIKSSTSHDFGVPEGTPVYAIKDGKVTESKDLKGCDGRKCGDGMYSYGRVIRIDHNIPGKGSMVYAHLSKRLVEKGDKVKAGQIIGYSGNSGNSYGPHLHIDFDGNYVAVDWLKSQKPEIPPLDGNGRPSNTSCEDQQVAGSGDYTDDTENPIPKGEQVAQQAKQWAKNDSNCGFHTNGCANHCLGIVSDLWSSAGKSIVSGDTAWHAYQRYKANGWVNKTKDIPIGAIMWSYDPKDANPVGHAYTYVGNGLVASNDIIKTGVYSVVPADLIETKWGHKFLGWSEWHG